MKKNNIVFYWQLPFFKNSNLKSKQRNISQNQILILYCPQGYNRHSNAIILHKAGSKMVNSAQLASKSRLMGGFLVKFKKTHGKT
ncbi:hypothetical protein AMJ48_02580 [Parcubacteria bacterium DG_74_1]|nr:MAG: hypothetical protein AMJ48_02580 [Parcubacteria bacterium DG_74_1]